MQFSHALILAFVASVAAQTGTIEGDVAALPDCAKKCIDKATLDAGCKSITDYTCQCGSAHNTINNAAAPCVASTCAATDLTKVLSLTAEICKLVNAGGASSGSGSSAAEPSSAAPTSAAASTEMSSDTAKPTGTYVPSSTGGAVAPSSTGAAAPTSSKGAAATGSWNFAAVAAGAGAVAAGLM
ncbi:hypothetical protein VC83_08314 [Pseudogymnoascus destructans]|uniref:CFEM domain-containing protein n=2 Tax=Pseudogymnoascus destructans TaxID=655981 RepID=L8GEW2_PSED2|nr:uncharacterized protein VC83_08314 [Pseudogymnoascus destructans]ELR10706.1 hypothetical protein GMDG_04967 [Pseudogymnoascus destructans 20631-21]OAF55361.1 hypothetical protein VC83_08314 [Pseudogymnoascus destructans]